MVFICSCYCKNMGLWVHVNLLSVDYYWLLLELVKRPYLLVISGMLQEQQMIK